MTITRISLKNILNDIIYNHDYAAAEYAKICKVVNRDFIFAFYCNVVENTFSQKSVQSVACAAAQNQRNSYAAKEGNFINKEKSYAQNENDCA